MPTRTTQTTPQPTAEKKPLPRKNAGRSSEVNLDDIYALAREIDSAAQEEPEEKPKRGRKKKAEQQAAPEPVLPPVPVLITDPEFEEMLKWGIGSGVDWCKVRLDWSDPGVHWRNKTAVLVGRLWQRLQPMSESWVTDVITLGGYAALWVLPNVSARSGKGPAPDRDNGDRKNLQDEGTSKPGA